MNAGKQSQPSISVLMAIHNAMPYLPEAVESILAQSWSDFEFLIVDDHSSDDSAAYLSGLRDPRIRLLISPGQGQTDALNFGLAQAQGRWIARMDGDDVSLPHRLAQQTQTGQREPQALFISSDFTMCDESLHPIGTFSLNVTDPGFLRYTRSKQNPFCHPTMMFQRDAVAAVGGYPPRMRTAQDYALWLALLKQGPFAHVPEPLLKYRLRRGAVSIERYHEQRVSRERILSGNASQVISHPVAERHSIGMYAYRQGFAAWIAGDRRRCVQKMVESLRCGTRIFQALAAIVLSAFPRVFYLRLTGYDHVYR